MPPSTSSDSSPPINLALLGAGLFPHRAHNPALQPLISSQRINLIAIWSRTLKSAKSLKEKYTEGDKKCENVECFEGDEGLEKVLGRGDVKGVVVAVPIWKNAEIVTKALKAGKMGELSN